MLFYIFIFTETDYMYSSVSCIDTSCIQVRLRTFIPQMSKILLEFAVLRLTQDLFPQHSSRVRIDRFLMQIQRYFDVQDPDILGPSLPEWLTS